MSKSFITSASNCILSTDKEEILKENSKMLHEALQSNNYSHFSFAYGNIDPADLLLNPVIIVKAALQPNSFLANIPKSQLIYLFRKIDLSKLPENWTPSDLQHFMEIIQIKKNDVKIMQDELLRAFNNDHILTVLGIMEIGNNYDCNINHYFFAILYATLRKRRSPEEPLGLIRLSKLFGFLDFATVAGLLHTICVHSDERFITKILSLDLEDLAPRSTSYIFSSILNITLVDQNRSIYEFTMEAVSKVKFGLAIIKSVIGPFFTSKDTFDTLTKYLKEFDKGNSIDLNDPFFYYFYFSKDEHMQDLAIGVLNYERLIQTVLASISIGNISMFEKLIPLLEINCAHTSPNKNTFKLKMDAVISLALTHATIDGNLQLMQEFKLKMEPRFISNFNKINDGSLLLLAATISGHPEVISKVLEWISTTELFSINQNNLEINVTQSDAGGLTNLDSTNTGHQNSLRQAPEFFGIDSRINFRERYNFALIHGITISTINYCPRKILQPFIENQLKPMFLNYIFSDTFYINDDYQKIYISKILDHLFSKYSDAPLSLEILRFIETIAKDNKDLYPIFINKIPKLMVRAVIINCFRTVEISMSIIKNNPLVNVGLEIFFSEGINLAFKLGRWELLVILFKEIFHDIPINSSIFTSKLAETNIHESSSSSDGGFVKYTDSVPESIFKPNKVVSLQSAQTSRMKFQLLIDSCTASPLNQGSVKDDNASQSTLERDNPPSLISGETSRHMFQSLIESSNSSLLKERPEKDEARSESFVEPMDSTSSPIKTSKRKDQHLAESIDSSDSKKHKVDEGLQRRYQSYGLRENDKPCALLKFMISNIQNHSVDFIREAIKCMLEIDSKIFAECSLLKFIRLHDFAINGDEQGATQVIEELRDAGEYGASQSINYEDVSSKDDKIYKYKNLLCWRTHKSCSEIVFDQYSTEALLKARRNSILNSKASKNRVSLEWALEKRSPLLLINDFETARHAIPLYFKGKVVNCPESKILLKFRPVCEQTEDLMCLICFVKFSSACVDLKIPVQLECCKSHIFCHSCLLNWVSVRIPNNCPICRKPI